MTSRARKINELPAATTIDSDDLIVIEKVTGANSVTSQINGNNLKTALFAGPYDDDTAAAAGTVLLGEPYYTTTGALRIRIV